MSFKNFISNRENLIFVLLIILAISIFKIAFWRISINVDVSVDGDINTSTSIDGSIDTDTDINGYVNVEIIN